MRGPVPPAVAEAAAKGVAAERRLLKSARAITRVLAHKNRLRAARGLPPLKEAPEPAWKLAQKRGRSAACAKAAGRADGAGAAEGSPAGVAPGKTAAGAPLAGASSRKRSRDAGSENASAGSASDEDGGSTSAAAAAAAEQEALRKAETRRTVQVTGCPIDCAKRQLRKYLELPKEAVESIRFRSISLDPRFRRLPQVGVQRKAYADGAFQKVAYIVLTREADVKPLIAAKHGLVVGEKPACVLQLHTVSFKKQFSVFPVKSSLFVGNVYVRATEAQLWTFAESVLGAGTVASVRLVRDKATALCRGYGFVCLKDRAGVAAAVAALHGRPFRRRPLNVTPALREDEARAEDAARRARVRARQKAALRRAGVRAERRPGEGRNAFKKRLRREAEAVGSTGLPGGAAAAKDARPASAPPKKKKRN